MIDSLANSDRLLYLADIVCDNRASDSDLAELDAILLSDEASRYSYLDYCRMYATLELDLQAQRAVQKAWQQIDFEQASPFDANSNLTAVSLPAVRDTSPPVLTLLPTTLHGAAGYFSSDWLVSYLISTVICGIGILIGASTYVSQPGNSVVSGQWSVASKSNPQSLIPNPTPKAAFVGRITGMVDCRWEEGSGFGVQGSGTENLPSPDQPSVGARRGAGGEGRIEADSIHPSSFIPHLSSTVSLGDKFALSSGLLEITYNTGAKVILQGPVQYEVEATNGGFLSIGKLTGKVEAEKTKGFVVRTPTATVTDLGTEFGVEVSKEGRTTSHVYRGSVKLQALSTDGKAEGTFQILRENESACVESSINQDGHRLIVLGRLTEPAKFFRRLPTFERVPIPLFNTGVSLEEGQPDPHWQAIAVSNGPDFQPGPAQVADPKGAPWLANDFDHSQWITFSGGNQRCVNFTFQTTFDLSGMRPATAIIRGQFIADNFVRAIRINGNEVPVSPQSHTPSPSFSVFTPFDITSGFVGGLNILEIEVGNYEQEALLDSFSPLGLRVELTGTALKEIAVQGKFDTEGK